MTPLYSAQFVIWRRFEPCRQAPGLETGGRSGGDGQRRRQSHDWQIQAPRQLLPTGRAISTFFFQVEKRSEDPILLRPATPRPDLVLSSEGRFWRLGSSFTDLNLDE